MGLTRGCLARLPADGLAFLMARAAWLWLENPPFSLWTGSSCSYSPGSDLLKVPDAWLCLLAGTPELSPADRKELETKLKEREEFLVPIYHQVAMQFADLHDTPGRMQEKGAITVSATELAPARGKLLGEAGSKDPGVPWGCKQTSAPVSWLRHRGCIFLLCE